MFMVILLVHVGVHEGFMIHVISSYPMNLNYALKIFENNLWVLNIGIFGFMIHVIIINDNPSNPHLPGQAGGSVRVLEHVGHPGTLLVWNFGWFP